MHPIIQEIEDKSVVAFDAYRIERSRHQTFGANFGSVEINFSNGQRVWVSCLSLPNHPEKITLNERDKIKVLNLMAQWKDKLNLVGFTFTDNLYHAGLFSNESKSYDYQYSIADRSIKTSDY